MGFLGEIRILNFVRIFLMRKYSLEISKGIIGIIAARFFWKTHQGVGLICSSAFRGYVFCV